MTNSVIVKFTKRSPTDSVKDVNATVAVDAQFHSKNGGKFMKKLLSDCKQHKALNSKLNESYSWHKNKTMPYLDNGLRMMKGEFVEEYAEHISEDKATIESLKRDLKEVYNEAIEADKNRLGSLFNPNDYPPWDVLADKYGIDIKFLPKPEKQDFRFELDDKYKNDLDEMMEEAKIAGRKELFARAAKVVSTLKESCDKTGETRRHESSLTNIEDLASTMEILNVHDDAEVRYLIRDMRAVISGITIWDLRNTEVVRKFVSDRCRDFLNSVSGGGFTPDVEPAKEVDTTAEESYTESNLVDSLV